MGLVEGLHSFVSLLRSSTLIYYDSKSVSPPRAPLLHLLVYGDTGSRHTGGQTPLVPLPSLVLNGCPLSAIWGHHQERNFVIHTQKPLSSHYYQVTAPQHLAQSHGSSGRERERDRHKEKSCCVSLVQQSR